MNIDKFIKKEFSSIEWGEFSLGDIFEVLSSKKRFDANKVKILSHGRYPYVARQSSNNGHRGFIVEDKNYLNEGNTISFGQDTATIFYQKNPYFTGDKIKILKDKTNRFSHKNAQFFISAMNKTFSTFSWGNTSFAEDVIRNQKLKLPVNNHGEIDFNFMNKITKSQKQEKIELLKTYLQDNELIDFNLNSKEKTILDEFKKKSFGRFKIEDVLDWQKKISEIDPLKLDKLSISNKKKNPFYGQSTTNNGIIDFYDLEEDVLNNRDAKPTILIHSNNQNIVYLEKPFYLKDGHGATSVLQSDCLDKLSSQFIITSIKKVISKKFSYNNKATKIALKETVISLPIKHDQTPDYEYMSSITLIMHKLIINNLKSLVTQEVL